jgi:outer membrane protein assembly factor BamE (lipoprotein component of BamABCDE complex)
MRNSITILIMALLTACVSLPAGNRNLTVGSVQSQIYVGMSGAEVAEALGSPNIVTTDQYRNETWIYDKIYTEASESESHDVTGTLRYLDVWGPLAATSTNRRSTSSQRTLTVIIKFDEFGEVYDFAYHTSRF